ncbi:MFS transporter [Caenibius sp. WL]|uniref:spinster family MFS transporter n=1 Tax=Caenibius sp. WL TaxID=2872646 RepID=UPI001C995067|nr:MFS transporter [Caenibius sp. WL]QZP07858.1 MFS transporter [Caenibius sp. WL]
MTETDAQPAPALTSRQANFALVVFLLAYVLSFVDRQILALMVDPIREDLGLSDIQIGLLQGFAFAILYAVMGLPFGMLADRVSRRKIIAAGVIFWSFATAMCGLARSFAMLFLARIGVGVGEAALSPAAHSYLSSAFPREKLGRTMAIYNLGVTGGTGIALIIGGAVVQLIANSGNVHLPIFGELRAWQTAFLVVAAPGALITLLVLATKEPPRQVNRETGKHSVPLGDVFRYLWANRRTFLSIYLSAGMFGIYGYSLAGWYPALMQRNFGLTAGEAGTILGLAYAVMGSVGLVTGGMLADRLAKKGYFDSNQRVVAWVGAAVVIPAAITPLMPNMTLLTLLLIPSIFLFYNFFGCSIAAVQLASPPSMRGTNSAIYLMINSFIGLSVGSVAAPLTNAYLFGGKELALSLAVVAAIGCGCAGLFALWGLRSYGQLAERQAVLIAQQTQAVAAT